MKKENPSTSLSSNDDKSESIADLPCYPAISNSISRSDIDPVLKTPSTWPIVDTNKLEVAAKEIYHKRYNAIFAYFEGASHKSIQQKWNLNRGEIKRLRDRFLTIHPDGRIWGPRALIPGTRIKPYLRTKPPKSKDKGRQQHPGELTRLFSIHANVKEKVYRHFLRRSRGASEKYIPISSSHNVFIKACREAGVRSGEYPFNTKYLGIRSLSRHLKKLLTSDLLAVVRAQYGSSAANSLKTGTGIVRNSPVRLPYQRVEFDAHRIHAIFILKVPVQSGGYIEVLLERPWLLLLIDTISRNVLSWHLSMSSEYNDADVMRCLRKAIQPWKRNNLSIEGLSFHPSAGMPSEVFPDLHWALWDELCFDNAKAHLSNWVVTQVTSVLGCSINAGAVRVPERRAIVESFFGYLAEAYIHRLPNTTGNGPKDHRVEGSEEAALRYKIHINYLYELIEVIISNYNGTPLSALQWRSPLELMRYYLEEEKIIIQKLQPHERHKTKLLSMKLIRPVRGNIKKGRRPYINYERARYTNEVLARSPELIGTELSILVDVDDVTSVLAVLPNGTELGYLTAIGGWGRTPHSLATRKLAGKRQYLKVQYNANEMNIDPVMALLDTLNEEAKKNKKSAAKFKQICDEAGITNEDARLKQEALKKLRKIKDNAETSPHVNSAKKTIVY